MYIHFVFIYWYSVPSAVVNARENLIEGLNGSVLMVELLLTHGIPIYLFASTISLPSHINISFPIAGILTPLLLILGARLNVSNNKGDTPLHW